MTSLHNAVRSISLLEAHKDSPTHTELLFDPAQINEKKQTPSSLYTTPRDLPVRGAQKLAYTCGIRVRSCPNKREKTDSIYHLDHDLSTQRRETSRLEAHKNSPTQHAEVTLDPTPKNETN